MQRRPPGPNTYLAAVEKNCELIGNISCLCFEACSAFGLYHTRDSLLSKLGGELPNRH